MAEALFEALAPIVTRWTMGGAGASAASGDLRAALGDDPVEAELRLLALSGQFLGALVVAEPTGPIATLPDIPALAVPPLPDPLRPMSRRLLQTLRDGQERRHLVSFLAHRGWSLHPADWLPGANEEDVPDLYAPWRDWVASPDLAGRSDDEALTAESWSDFGPAARAAAFAILRRRDPSAARLLLEAKLAGEGADMRVRLVGLLAASLSQEDQPLLVSLASDRAPRVQALAASLLGRLGQGSAAGEDAAELAGFFAIRTKGLLRRTRVVAAQDLKTPAQRSRRAALIESVDLSAFAGALQLQPDELVSLWPWGEDRAADLGLAGMAERSGSDATVIAIGHALTEGNSVGIQGLQRLLPRLPSAQRREAAALVLRANGGSFAIALTLAGTDGRIDRAIGSSAGTALLAALGAEDAKPSDGADELAALGLIASRDAARDALERLAQAGLLAADPRLDMLRLNAALDDKGAMG